MRGRCIVISAVNFTEGGPLTILKEFVAAACKSLPLEWEIVVFVHDRKLLQLTRPRFIEIPGTKTSWLRRLYIEWLAFHAYAKRLKPDLWVSLHDITPRIGTVRQAVYCHNPMPFYRMRLRDAWLDPRALMFRAFYGLLYRINLKRNYAVIVQQSWLRNEFTRWVGKDTRIIVSHPVVQLSSVATEQPAASPDSRVRFLYPTLPRIFKNIELVCRAVQALERMGDWRSEVILTIDGSENRYSRWLRHCFGSLRTVRFAGRHTVKQMRELYGAVDCLLFPSLLETWGLPITEAKLLSLPMLVADLPYAHETVGAYDKVLFINAHKPAEWGREMLAFQDHRCAFVHAAERLPGKPFAADWRQLLSLLTEDLD
jgi:glycosyltransferase involved in cell wall biosynthesis